MLVKYLISLRNLFFSNFFVKVCAIESNNKLIDTNTLYHKTLFILYRFIPFILTKNMYNYCGKKLIYQYDNIYNITYNDTKNYTNYIKFNINER
jgi:hypothetical protein